jgi:hypothetical protein
MAFGRSRFAEARRPAPDAGPLRCEMPLRPGARVTAVASGACDRIPSYPASSIENTDNGSRRPAALAAGLRAREAPDQLAVCLGFQGSQPTAQVSESTIATQAAHELQGRVAEEPRGSTARPAVTRDRPCRRALDGSLGHPSSRRDRGLTSRTRWPRGGFTACRRRGPASLPTALRSRARPQAWCGASWGLSRVDVATLRLDKRWPTSALGPFVSEQLYQDVRCPP